jgi:hypothetical protein
MPVPTTRSRPALLRDALQRGQRLRARIAPALELQQPADRGDVAVLRALAQQVEQLGLREFATGRRRLIEVGLGPERAEGVTGADAPRLRDGLEAPVDLGESRSETCRVSCTSGPPVPRTVPERYPDKFLERARRLQVEFWQTRSGSPRPGLSCRPCEEAIFEHLHADADWSPRRHPLLHCGRGSGVPVEAMTYNVWTVRHGKAIRVRGYLSRSDALEAAGLRE